MTESPLLDGILIRRWLHTWECESLNTGKPADCNCQPLAELVSASEYLEAIPTPTDRRKWQ